MTAYEEHVSTLEADIARLQEELRETRERAEDLTASARLILSMCNLVLAIPATSDSLAAIQAFARDIRKEIAE